MAVLPRYRSAVRHHRQGVVDPYAGFIAYDSYTHPDSAISPGTPEKGGPYVIWAGIWGITSGQLYCSNAASDGAIVVDTGKDDQDVSITSTMTEFGASNGVIVRGASASGFIAVTHDDSGVYVLKETAPQTHSLLTTIASVPFSSGVPYTFRATIAGLLITAYVSGSSVGTYTLAGGDATTYAHGTYAGVFTNSSSANLADNLRII